MTSSDAQLQFLVNMQKLLEEGGFAATYKYALLLAIADLSVEKGDDTGGPLVLATSEIAEKFIRYYWRQSIPYVVADGDSAILLQNTGKQALVLLRVTEVYKTCRGSLFIASRWRGWPGLVREVDEIVREMPLWRLQTVGRQPLEFLYRNEPGARQITLLPGICASLRRFHGLVRDMVQGAWIRRVRRIRANQRLLGQASDLGEFMFGSERSPRGSARRP